VASQKFQQLIASIQADQASLQALQQTQQGQLDQAQQLSDQLQTLDAQLQGQQAQLRQEQSSLTGQAAQLVAQRNSIQGQISALQAEQLAASEAGQGWVTVNGALTPFAFGPQPDYFPWGQCTWYVASLRHVYWGGNADAWYWNAQAAGAPTGHTPQPGSIVVWGPGSLYNALYGHVAYVRYVISPTNFVVDEGNFLGLGVSDQRDVPTLYDVEGFIY
jgi:surface antigen